MPRHLTFIHNTARIRLETPVRALQSQLALLLVEYGRLLGPIWQYQNRQQPNEYRRSAFHDEQQLPIRDRRVHVLDPERDKAAERARDRREPKPVRHAHSHFFLGVEER